MGITTRILGVEDADALVALMTRIEGDHPTGFCLGAGEIREVMGGQERQRLRGGVRRRRAGRLHDRAAGSPRRVRPARHPLRRRRPRAPRRGHRDPHAHPLAPPLACPPCGPRARGAGTVRGRHARRSRGPGRPGGAGGDATRTAQLPHGRPPRATVRGRAAGRVLRHRVRPGGRRGAPAGPQRRLRRPSRPRRCQRRLLGDVRGGCRPRPARALGDRPGRRRRGRRLRPRPRVRRTAVGRVRPRGPCPLRRHPPGAPRPRAWRRDCSPRRWPARAGPATRPPASTSTRTIPPVRSASTSGPASGATASIHQLDVPPVGDRLSR